MIYTMHICNRSQPERPLRSHFFTSETFLSGERGEIYLLEIRYWEVLLPNGFHLKKNNPQKKIFFFLCSQMKAMNTWQCAPPGTNRRNWTKSQIKQNSPKRNCKSCTEDLNRFHFRNPNRYHMTTVLNLGLMQSSIH